MFFSQNRIWQGCSWNKLGFTNSPIVKCKSRNKTPSLVTPRYQVITADLGLFRRKLLREMLLWWFSERRFCFVPLCLHKGFLALWSCKSSAHFPALRQLGLLQAASSSLSGICSRAQTLCVSPPSCHVCSTPVTAPGCLLLGANVGV